MVLRKIIAHACQGEVNCMKNKSQEHILLSTEVKSQKYVPFKELNGENLTILGLIMDADNLHLKELNFQGLIM